MSSGAVVLSYGDYVIRESELRLLQKKEWLNDVLIGFYLEYLGKEQSKSTSFIGPEVAQLLKMISADQVPIVLGDLVQTLKVSQYIFLPVNDSFDPEVHSGGSHWSLLIFSRIDNAFVHFDSTVGNSNQADAEQLFKKLRSVISTSKSTSPPSFSNYKDCLKQVNGYDCGVHVICNAQLISQYVQSHQEVSILKSGCPSVTPQDAKAMRSKLVELIQRLAEES